jgi:hypothetical protein
MGEFNVKIAGTPTPVEVPWGKVSGTWRRGKKLYTKIAGSWVLAKEYLVPLPSNMIVLYTDSDDIPAGGSIETAVASRMAFGATSDIYGAGGDTSHNGTEHGLASDGTSTYSHTSRRSSGIIGRLPDTRSSHSHSVGSHNHAGNWTVEPPFRTVIPSTGADFATSDSVWLTIDDIAGWFRDSTYTGRYIRLFGGAGTAANGGASSHTHNTTNINTSEYSAATNVSSGSNATTYPRDHNHSANHNHGADANDPLYVNVGMFSPPSTIGLDDIPSNVVAFFNSTVLPAGWSQYAVSNGKFFRVTTSGYGGTGGSSTHSIRSATNTTGGRNSTGPDRTAASGGGDYSIGSHTHTFTHGHSTAITMFAPYRKVYVGVKD